MARNVKDIEFIETVGDLLRSQSTLALATSAEDGSSLIAPLFYLSTADLRLYWFSSPSSEHSQNVERNGVAAVSVYRPTDQWKEICGLQMRGTVSVVTDQEERKSIEKAYADRFHLGTLFATAIGTSKLYVFRPCWVRYINNSSTSGTKSNNRSRPRTAPRYNISPCLGTACDSTMTDALEAVKVVELGGYAAGPCIGKYLANFGAQVLHVESTQHPDGFRLQYPPYKDGKVGVNRSGCFAFFSDSKYGVTLNLKHPKGLELGYRLMEWADILIENMRPGVVSRMGFGYDVLHRGNPGLIMLSTSNLGQTGPHAAHPGFGSQLSSLSGFCHLIGEPEGPPHMLYGPYIDFIAVAYGGAAALAALDHRRRTGEGVYIDLSQYEAGLQFIGSALLDYSSNGVVADRAGNRDPMTAPHACFPCRDGQWCAISCWNDEEWERFCRAAGQAGWLTDPRFATASSRKEHEEALNGLIAAWTSGQSSEPLMNHLQGSGVHAAKVNTMRDLFSDPQIAFRHVWQQQEHPEIGRHRYRMVSYQLSEAPGSVRGPAPCLGEHNQQAFLEWLKLPAEEYREFQEQGVFC